MLMMFRIIRGVLDINGGNGPEPSEETGEKSRKRKGIQELLWKRDVMNWPKDLGYLGNLL
jgi:hypothetical protein